MQATSAMFLQKFERSETKRSRLYNELLDHQKATTLEREAEHKKHIQALDDACAEFSHEVDKITAETEARVQSMNTTYEVVAAQLRLELKQAKQDNLALQTLHDEREDRINTLVMKQCQKLNRKIDETLDAGWKKWSAQATELQVLRADTENRQKEGKGFFKMDKTSIGMIREDLEEDFYALADGHTKAISVLLEEFNDDQMVLRIAAEQAMDITPTDSDEGPSKLVTGTSLNDQSNEPRDEGSNDVRSEPETVTEPAEGIFHILTED